MGASSIEISTYGEHRRVTGDITWRRRGKPTTVQRGGMQEEKQNRSPFGGAIKGAEIGRSLFCFLDYGARDSGRGAGRTWRCDGVNHDGSAAVAEDGVWLIAHGH